MGCVKPVQGGIAPFPAVRCAMLPCLVWVGSMRLMVWTVPGLLCVLKSACLCLGT